MTQKNVTSKLSTAVKTSVALEPGGIRAKKGSMVRNNQGVDLKGHQNLYSDSVRSFESNNDEGNFSSNHQQHPNIPMPSLPKQRVNKGFLI